MHINKIIEAAMSQFECTDTAELALVGWQQWIEFALSLDRWIEIKEGCEMPGPDETVIIAYELVPGDIRTCRYPATYSNGNWYLQDDFKTAHITVTHWQPLPKPPKNK